MAVVKASQQTSRALGARSVALLLSGLAPLMAGCANELGPDRSMSKLGGPVARTPGTALSPALEGQSNLMTQEPLRRGAHSDRVLSAIALERVTGRQPAADRLLPQP